MKNKLFAATLVGVGAFSYGFAQTDPAAPPQQDFATFKAQHLARLQQEIACVEAATSFDSMRACRPPPPEGHRGPPPGNN